MAPKAKMTIDEALDIIGVALNELAWNTSSYDSKINFKALDVIKEALKRTDDMAAAIKPFLTFRVPSSVHFPLTDYQKKMQKAYDRFAKLK